MVTPTTPAAPPSSIDPDLLPRDEDLLYEEELLRNPYSLKMWWRYLEARKDVEPKRRYLMYERAIAALPGSYKLWHAYLDERRVAVRGLVMTHPGVEALNNTYERALVTMHKMPRMWLMYLEHLMSQKLLTRTRRVFDRCLCSLPITQHDRIWQLFLKFLTQQGVPVETAIRVYRRYLQYEPSHAEEYITYLKAKGIWGEAARKLAELVNDDTFRSLEGKSKHQLWLELCDIITKHPKEVQGLKVDAILRSGIRKFTDEVGRLWTSLADYYIRQGMYEKARDVYEEGLTTVITVRDFSLIFDTLTAFEENLISYKMQHAAEEEEDDEEAAAAAKNTNGDEDDDGTDFLLKDDEDDLDLRLARLEHLMDRRPVLLSSVMLRQNPHNVHEWHKRVKLFEGQPMKQIITFTEAVKTVDVNKAIGKLHTLWAAFAKLYERAGDLDNARIIFEKATEVQYKYLDDLASVWCEWAEMELRHKHFKRALDLMRTATVEQPSFGRRKNPAEEREGPVQGRLYRSLKLWSFYCDLEESLGTLESTKAVYERILELKIATPQIVLNYALFLQEHKFWEESFRVYEKGVSLFKFPHNREIWQSYLAHFVQRYGGTKLERSRDLFRQAISETPAEESKPLFLQFAQLEEKYGLARSAMEVYDLAVRTIPEKERLPVYDLYLARASESFGIGKVREIYETAIEAQPPYNLTDEDCKTMCVRYATLERRLGEIDRARAIFVHASSLADPLRDKTFWREWNEFEVSHGNEDTFREMLRIRRSVAASFSQTHFNTSIIDAATTGIGTGTEDMERESGKRRREDDMEALEEAVQATTRIPGFVSAGVVAASQPQAVEENGGGALPPPPMAANPEDIELDEGEDDDAAEDADEGPDIQLETKAVPEAVYGSSGVPVEKIGALDRFKKRKVGA